MKKAVAIVSMVLLVVASTIFLISFSGCSKKEQKVVKIGAVLPLTGPGALWGNNTRKGAELAVEEVSRRWKDKKLILIAEDSKGLAREGVSVIQKLINVDKIDAVLDDAVSSVALAIVPIITKNKLTTISTGSTNPKLSGASPYFFRLWNSDTEEAVISARFIGETLKYKKGVIFYILNDYGEGLKQAFEKEFARYNGKIIGKESFKQGAASFREQLLKLKSMNPEFMYLIGYPTEIPRILVEMKKLHFDVQVITTAAVQDKSILEQAKDAAEGVIYPYPKPVKTEITEKFIKEYKEKYNELPGSPAAEAYDAIMIFAEAFENVGKNREKIRDYVASIEFKGASGYVKFDKNGDVHKPMEIKIIKNGKFQTYFK